MRATRHLGMGDRGFFGRVSMGLSKRWLFAVFATVLGVALLPGPAAASGGPTVSSVVSGLDSPRGITFFNGQLVVAEAGHGGTLCVPAGPTGEACIGNTSQISWVNRTAHTHTAFLTGLFSLSLGAEGTIGASGLAVSDGRLLAQIGATPQELPGIGIGQAQAGRLIWARTNNTWSTVAKVGETDFNYTLRFTEPSPTCGQCPGTQEHDSNPYGLLATDESVYVADAGSNTLDRVSEDGNIRILLRDGWRDPNPNFPSDAVPTCVVKTEDGFLVGELSGRLLKVHGNGFTVIHNSLFSHITGCTSDRHGNVYFVNMFGPGNPPMAQGEQPSPSFINGSIVKFNARTEHASLLVNHEMSPNLLFPNMDTIGPDGNLYVSNGSICAATLGQPPCFAMTGGVLKITLPHEDND